jgi:hypothetical protein
MTLNDAFRLHYYLLRILAIFSMVSTLSAQSGLPHLAQVPGFLRLPQSNTSTIVPIKREFAAHSLPQLQYGPPQVAMNMDTEVPIFITALVYPAGYQSTFVAVGDFNGDGKADLVVTNQCEQNTCDQGSVSVLLGNGDGTFQPTVTYPSGGHNARFVAIGDINGDRKPDLVVLNELNTGLNLVTILLGNGNGSFQPAVNFNPTANGVYSLALGDFNNDGEIDVAVTDGTNVTVFLATGNGMFQMGVSYPVPAGAGSVLVGDLNNDGKSDFVINGNNGTSVLLGNGDGTFSTAIAYAPGGSSSVILGDFNGDGNLDVLFAQNFSFGLFLGNGDGTLQPELTYAWSFASNTSMAAGDFNGDGKLDLAMVPACTDFVCDTESVNVVLGNGDGTFQLPAVYAVGDAPGVEVATLDFNTDGKLDIAVVGFSNTGSVSPLLGNGDGTFRAPREYPAGAGGSAQVVGDFNADGKFDLAVATQCIDLGCEQGGVSILLGNGDGTFAATVNYPTQRKSLAVAMEDFNRDGKLDLAVTNLCTADPKCYTGSVSVLLGNGDGTFKPAVNYSTEYNPGSVAIGDFNGDGKLDLAVANTCISHFCSINTKGSISILFGNGDGTFQPAVNHPTGHYPVSLVVGDFNEDGNADIALGVRCAEQGCTTGITVLLGKGDGSFRTTTYPTSYEPNGLAVADLNGDGKMDLIVAMSECLDNSCGTGIVEVFLGNGDGTFQAPLNFSAPQQEFSVAVADFDGDGKPDVAAESWSGVISLLLGNGDGTLRSSATLLLPSGHSLVTGDFNHDGKPDIAANGPGIAILLNNASGFRYATTASLTSSLNPSFEGQAVTLTASVVPTFFAGKPTGKITFNDGTSMLASVSLKNGKAVFSTSSLSVGIHQLTIAYSGDSKYVPELSAAVTQTIELAPTTTKLISNTNPSTSGRAVTFTATVTSQGPASPSGEVVFKDGTRTIGLKSLSGGVATLTRSNLAAGSHSITATYTGDAASAKSASTVLTQVVN